MYIVKTSKFKVTLVFSILVQLPENSTANISTNEKNFYVNHFAPLNAPLTPILGDNKILCINFDFEDKDMKMLDYAQLEAADISTNEKTST